MSTHKFELEAIVREDIGKGASRRLRHSDKVPAIVYGAGQDAVSLTLDHNKISHALSQEAFYSRILTLKVGKNHEKVVLKAVQRDPAKPRIAHVDFLRVRPDQKLHMHIPLHFIGEEKAPGLEEGGIFSHLMTDIEVSCLPDHLPEFIEVDVSNMMLNQSIHLSDLKIPKGVELVALAHGATEEHNLPVVSIHIPRIIEEEVVEVAVEEAAAEETAEQPAGEEAGSAETQK